MKEVINGSVISDDLYLEMRESIKVKIYKYSPLVPILYFPFYSIWFFALEKITTTEYMIYSPID